MQGREIGENNEHVVPLIRNNESRGARSRSLPRAEAATRKLRTAETPTVLHRAAGKRGREGKKNAEIAALRDKVTRGCNLARDVRREQFPI